MDINAPPNVLLRIDELWAFVSVDAQGNEGLVAAPMGGLGMVPLIAADKARLKSLIPMAEMIAKQTPMTIKLVRLSTREEIREFRP